MPRFVGHRDANWDAMSFDLDKDLALTLKNASFIEASDPNLSKFKARGGKLLLWHGWADPGPAPENTINYYSQATKAAGGGSPDDWMRLFLLPGVAHCGGGVGPDQADFLGALERWREQGVAPGADHGVAQPGPRRPDADDATVVSVPAGREVQGHRQHGRGRQLRLRCSLARLIASRGADVSSSPGTSRRPRRQLVAGVDRHRRWRLLHQAPRCGSSTVKPRGRNHRGRVGRRVGIGGPGPCAHRNPSGDRRRRSALGVGAARSVEYRSQSRIPAPVERSELRSKPMWHASSPSSRRTVVWLDGLVQNPDRTAKNPNMIWSHGQLWLIDHGASLGFHHDWSLVTEDSPRRRGWNVSNHVLSPRATRLSLVDEALATRVDRQTLESAVEEVPDDFLSERDRETLRRRRAAVRGVPVETAEEPSPFRAETRVVHRFVTARRAGSVIA